MDRLAIDESESELGEAWENDRSPDSGQATVCVEEDSFEPQEHLHVWSQKQKTDKFLVGSHTPYWVLEANVAARNSVFLSEEHPPPLAFLWAALANAKQLTRTA